jgi:hypothetical protein
MQKHLPIILLLFLSFIRCTSSTDRSSADTGQSDASSQSASTGDFAEGEDYTVFERVRILDKTAFTEPQEAYSLVLPKGWTHEGEIVWSAPTTTCAGTSNWLKAKSPDGKFSLEVFPDIVYSWQEDPQLQQFSQNHSDPSSNCRTGEPMNAETYLKNAFAADELGNAEVINVTHNAAVVEQMAENNQKNSREMEGYGARSVQFYQTAINADVRWKSGENGFVVLGSSIMEGTIPNVYDGTSSKIYTTQITKRIVFKYPADESEQAKNIFSVMMSGIRTNTAWRDAVNQYWKSVREKKHIEHLGRLKMTDEMTRQMGEQAIQNGANRLAQMDNQMRSWEAQQSSQDRMHTNFIKTIREVENYQDASGKVELSSGYNHAWSRNDGSTFLMSNNPNFNPSSVFQDQNWQEMKKVE